MGLGRSRSGPPTKWLTFPNVYVIYCAAMETMQMRARRAATGGAAHGRQGAAHGHQGVRNAKRMNGQAKGLSDSNTCFICDTDESRSGIRGKCSLRFA